MTIKLIGALLIILGCGGFGFHIASKHKREERLLHQLINVLDYFTSELQYRLTPLPHLCKRASVECTGTLGKLFLTLSNELEQQVSPNAEVCMRVALSRASDLPSDVHKILRKLGHCLGRFDLDGQLKDIDFVRNECVIKLSSLSQNRDTRLRAYQTLGLCAGAALAILFI